ncbi:hypothetical protein F1C76_02335 [Geodermatophilaceae bacterium NBWT11]|nr:hypothetical protein F1C76_02335 [Geodermatophilaceae bacterium NBWT11]
MTVLYRAMWTDDRVDASDELLAAFQAWFTKKTRGLRLEDSATVSAALQKPELHVEGTLRRARYDSSIAVKAALVEINPAGERWQTTLNCWTADSEAGRTTWAWVDVEAEGPSGMAHVTIAAPTVVNEMLGDGFNTRCGPVPLLALPRYFVGSQGGEALAEILSDQERSIPALVMSLYPPVASRFTPASRFQFEDVALFTARRLAGAVPVFVVDEAASDALSSALGRDHGVWGASCRVYQPLLDPARGTPWLHPLVKPDRYLTDRARASKIVMAAVGASITTRRPPASYVGAKSLLDADRSEGESSEWVRILEEENTALLGRMNEVQASLRAAEDGHLGATADFEAEVERTTSLTERLDAAVRTVSLLRSRLTELAEDDSASLTAPLSSLPDKAGSSQEAVDLARAHLWATLVVHPDACRDLDHLDTAVEGPSWGQKAWDGFRALAAYGEHLASAETSMDFWNWCLRSQHPRVWPATDKHLAMVESQSVRQNKRMASQRMLPVHRDVSPSGVVSMEAHLKISTGGGMLAPRIYFKASQELGKVFVGYFGPHKHMSNTKT